MKVLGVQWAALEASAGAKGFAYYMEQGLGKTLTTLLDFKRLVDNGLASRLVVVCPNSFKNGWREEAEKHGVDFDFFIWEAGKEEYFKAWVKRGFSKPPVVVINYESMRAKKVLVGKKKSWSHSQTMLLISAFVQGRKAMIAFDESIKLKNHDSAQTIGALLMVKDFEYSRVLSGKPITQGPHDLWAQMRAIKQMEGRNYFAFRGAFCRLGGFKDKAVIGAQNEDILANMIDPWVFRATKADWTDLPPKVYTTREYRMTPAMADMYRQMHDEFVLYLNESEEVAVDAAITKYIKLAQIQCGWIYDEDGKIRWLIDNDANPRLNLLEQIIEEEVASKVAIVYHHKPVLQMLRTSFAHLHPAFISGGMKPDEISAQKDAFNNDPSCRTILLQDDASKYGHTLLGHGDGEDRCYTTIFFENNYSLDTRSQIEDRNHRHGQTADSVLYLDLVGTPLDREVVKALQRKEDVFQAVFSKLRRSTRPD